MSEAIRIEIPVSVMDNTGAGTKSVIGNLTAIEKAFQKIEKASRSIQRTAGSAVEIGIRADDTATPVISGVEDTVERVSGITANVQISADDSASQTISAASDAVNKFDGTSGQAGITADDGATQVVRAAEDAVENFDGTSGTAEIGASDNASQIISSISDLVEALDGATATVKIQAENNISGGRDSPSWEISGNPLSLGTATSALRSPITQAAGMLGVGFGVASSVDAFKDFEAVMSQVKAISGATGVEFDNLKEKAMQMGADTKFSAVESAEAFNYMAMAGWKPQQMMDGIGGIMSLAAASGESLASTSDIVTDALTAFGLKAGDAGHFSDVLAQASANANTNVGMLGESFKYVAPVAGAMKYSVEDTSLALGLMANASIKGSMAGTALKTSIANMASPTDAMAEAMNKYGISLTDNEGNMKSLKGVMDNLRGSLGGLSETEQTAAASTIFGKEAMAGMLAIINASEEDYNKLTDAVYNADGAAQRMSDTMMDNLAGSLEYLSGAVDEVQTAFGERLSPYLRGAADSLAEEMPAVKDKINDFMDFVDTKVSSMTASTAWDNASIFGKVNIAWDELIADPFMDWVGGTGKHLISTGIGKLFSEASKIFTGGGGLTSFLSAGIIAKGATSAASGITKFVNALGGFDSIGGKIAFTTTAVAAGIGAVAIAIDNYNEQKINDSLEEHFGNIALSAKQAQEFADQLIGVEFKTGVETSLGEFKNAESLRQEAEAALSANDTLEWKCSVGLELTEAEGEDYAANIATFIESKKGELTSAARAASEAIETVIANEQGNAMVNSLRTWFQLDEAEVGNLSSELTATVEAALTDGIIDVNEQAAINALQSKINNILSSWSAADAETQIDMIRQKYGHLTGKDLDSGAFSEIISSFQEAREATESEIGALSEEFYNLVNGAHNSGRLDDSGAQQWKGWWNEGILNKRGSSLANALSFETNTLRDTYGSEIESNLSKIAGGAQFSIEKQMNPLFANGGDIDMTAFQDYMNIGISSQKGNGSGALKRLYEQMEPDVQAMGEVMDRYREEFGHVPENLKQAYDEAIDVGAAAGSESAALQKYANALLENGGDEVVSALTDPSNPLYESIRNASPELGKAIDRALAETGDSIEIDDLMAKIKEIELDDSEAKSSIEQALQEFETSISNSGSQIEVSTDGIKVTLGEVEVDGQSAIEQIASAVGMTADELAQANNFSSAVEVPVGATITIPADQIGFDTSALQSATQEAADGVSAPPVDMQADATVTAGNVDTSSAVNEVASQTQGAFDETIPAEGNTDVTLAQTNNASEIYSEVGSQVNSTFAAGYSTSANVAVTLNWSIVNPTANISVGGAGTGSASVSASLHAEGGIMANPHLGIVAEDGPEAIIPLGSKRRSRGLDLWMQAGQALGVKMYADGGIEGKVPLNTGEQKSSTDLKASQNANIVVNLNPSFNINENQNSATQDIKDQLKELVNETAAELAARLKDVYSNMPVVV